MTIDSSAGQRLKSFVERIERLNVDAEAIKTDTKEVFAEAKGDGFDVKIIRKVIRLRKMDRAKRSEEESLVDLYMSALEGGDWHEPPPVSAKKDDEEDDAPAGAPSSTASTASPNAPAEPPPEPDTEAVAAEKGREAARGGAPVTANPYGAGTPQRVAWDLAWCAETGTDGMDIPAHLKPKKPGDE